ncbi:MAG TPA: hypothetical protein VF614_16915 [Chthoniobacteraceae bacterium]|jgi:hypothetical protein
MPAAVPNSEPAQITAGETITWSRALSEYPAPEWTLKYALQASGKDLITVVSAASGEAHLVTISAGTSLGYAAGSYIAVAYVENAAGSRYVVDRRVITILPSPLSGTDSSHAVRTLALIEAALEGRVPNGLESTDIDGQSLSRIPIADLHRLRDKYRREVFVEAEAARRAAGLRIRRTIGIRFVNP